VPSVFTLWLDILEKSCGLIDLLSREKSAKVIFENSMLNFLYNLIINNTVKILSYILNNWAITLNVDPGLKETI